MQFIVISISYRSVEATTLLNLTLASPMFAPVFMRTCVLRSPQNSDACQESL
eukprot:m.31934 g.31934  ORF g.31934 m.31934 type:complete len:52 (-) comp14069_c0_seq3:1468-1623(-)